MPTPWNGDERRIATRDHDTLIELVQITKTLAESMHSHRDAFDVHRNDDTNQFNSLKRNMWIATGFIIAVQAIPAISIIIKFFTK